MKKIVHPGPWLVILSLGACWWKLELASLMSMPTLGQCGPGVGKAICVESFISTYVLLFNTMSLLYIAMSSVFSILSPPLDHLSPPFHHHFNTFEHHFTNISSLRNTILHHLISFHHLSPPFGYFSTPFHQPLITFHHHFVTTFPSHAQLAQIQVLGQVA